jgi:hypothetical protein
MSLVVHPYAAAFPMLSDAELDALADDIRANGMRHPIVTWTDSDGVEWLVDGRNRLAACDIAGVDPVFETLPADADPLAIIESENEHRRHSTIGQRAMMRAKYLAGQGARVDGRWTRNSISGVLPHSEKWETWRGLMTDAGLVIDAAATWTAARDLADDVISGKTPFSEAVETAKALRSSALFDDQQKYKQLRAWLAELADIEIAIGKLADNPPADLAHAIPAKDGRAHESRAKQIRNHLRRIAAFIEERSA